MNFLAFVLRVFSFVFHLTLGVFLIGTAALSYRSHLSMHLDMLPFSDENLLRDTILLGVSAVGCALLALTRSFKSIFFLWTVIALCLMLKWFYFSSYEFDNVRQARGIMALTFGAVGAFFGAAWSVRTRKGMAIL